MLRGGQPPDDGHSSGAKPISYWDLASPSVALWRRATAPSYRGYGQDEVADIGDAAVGLGAGMIAGLILLSIFANYQLGKAMAPNEASEGKWAWGNAIGGTLFPPLTLGLALYKNYGD